VKQVWIDGIGNDNVVPAITVELSLPPIMKMHPGIGIKDAVGSPRVAVANPCFDNELFQVFSGRDLSSTPCASYNRLPWLAGSSEDCLANWSGPLIVIGPIPTIGLGVVELGTRVSVVLCPLFPRHDRHVFRAFGIRSFNAQVNHLMPAAMQHAAL